MPNCQSCNCTITFNTYKLVNPFFLSRLLRFFTTHIGEDFVIFSQLWLIPQSAMPLSAIATMTPLPSEDITPGMEGQIKEWLESYRPVRQRTVRSETTKDKAGALPPAVYAVHHTDESEERLRYPEENTVSSANAQRVVSIQFVDEGDVTEVFEDHREVQIDEYETDSDDEESDFEEHPEVVNRACVTRSGRAVRAFVRLDM